MIDDKETSEHQSVEIISAMMCLRINALSIGLPLPAAQKSFQLKIRLL
jgi:hypothetical protein